jgi:hypothetical protein
LTSEDLSRRATIFFAAAGTVLYVLLRLRGFSDACLWFDEVFSIHAAGMAWSEFFPFIALDIVHPPLSYILLKLWILPEAGDIRWLRLFPVFFSVLALLPIWLLSREMRLGPAAVASVFLFLAFNGTLIKYAQEVRMYAVLFCLSAFSGWAFLRFYKKGKGFFTLVVVNALMVYTHYFGWFIVGAEVMAIVVWQRIKTRRVLAMVGVEAALFAPWALYVLSVAEGAAALRQNIGWAEAPGFSALVGFFFDLTEPVYFQSSSADVHTFWPFSLPVAAACIGLLAALAVDWRNKSEEERGTVKRLAMMFAFPIVCAFALSVASPLSVWGTRHLLVSVVPLTLLIGAAVQSVSLGFLRNSVAIVMAVLFLGALGADAMRPEKRFVWCGWESFAAGVEPGRRVYLYEDLAAYQFWFARQDPSIEVFLVEDAEGVSEDKAYFMPRGFDEVTKVSEREIAGEEFFVAYAAESFDDTKAPLANLRARGYRFSEPQVFDGGAQRGFFVKVRMEFPPGASPR